MSEKQRLELKNQVEQLKTEARELINQDDTKKAKEKIAEAQNIQDKLDLEAKLDGMTNPGAKPMATGEERDAAEITRAYNTAFVNAIRNKRMTASDYDIIETYNAMTESTDVDGALLVPKDVTTKINEFKRSLNDISQLATVESVTTLTGSRVLEKLATMIPFAEITDDTADIDEMTNPQFETISYTVKKYGGWLPIPNDLLKDSDQNILAYITKWIAKKSVVTNNALFLAILNALTQKTFADHKAIQKAINVTLDPAHAVNAKIVTNQYGFQYLDTLTDDNGRPLLKDDLTQAGGKLFGGKQIQVLSASQMPNVTEDTTYYAPMYIGDYKEGVIKFDRQTYEIASTNVGGTAFRKDRTEVRAIEREQYKGWDTAAIVNGRIDVTDIVSL